MSDRNKQGDGVLGESSNSLMLSPSRSRHTSKVDDGRRVSVVHAIEPGTALIQDLPFTESAGDDSKKEDNDLSTSIHDIAREAREVAATEPGSDFVTNDSLSHIDIDDVKETRLSAKLDSNTAATIRQVTQDELVKQRERQSRNTAMAPMVQSVITNEDPQTHRQSESSASTMLERDARVKRQARSGVRHTDIIPGAVSIQAPSTMSVISQQSSDSQDLTMLQQDAQAKQRGRQRVPQYTTPPASPRTSGATTLQRDAQIKRRARQMQPEMLSTDVVVQTIQTPGGNVSPSQTSRSSNGVSIASADENNKFRERRAGRRLGSGSPGSPMKRKVAGKSTPVVGASQEPGPSNIQLNPQVGALEVFNTGAVVQHRPGHLTSQPLVSSSSQSMPPTGYQSPASAIQNGFTKSGPAQSYDEKESADEDTPFYKKKRFLLVVIMLVVVIGAGAGAGLALSGGGGDDNSIQVPSAAPTRTPVQTPEQDLWDAVRRDGAKYHIVENINLTDEDTLEDPSNPQFSAWRWLVETDELSIITSTPEEMTENDIQTLLTRYALAVMFYSLNGPAWVYKATDQFRWLQPEIDHCDWPFIACSGRDVKGFVTGGRPGSNFADGNVNMRGDFPTEMSFFTSMDTLRMPGNEIRSLDGLSTLMTESPVFEAIDFAGNPLDEGNPLYRFNAKTISLQNCGLEGTLPASFSDMTELVAISLADNSFSGIIADKFSSTSLRDVIISGNDFEGDIMELLRGRETVLANLGAAGNQFSGSLTSEIGNMVALSNLDVTGNDLVGSIPTELGRLTELSGIVGLGSNFELSGNLPTELGLMSLMKALDVSFTLVEGTIPDSFAGLSSLTELNLEGTFISGTLPTSVCELPKLTRILRSPDLDCLGCPLCVPP